MRTNALILFAVAALAMLTIPAQGGQGQGGQGARGGGRGGRGGQTVTTPEADIIFRAQNALGVLRGLDQVDSVGRIEYRGAGTITRQGQSYKLTDYHASINYAMPGMRVDLKREEGTPQRVIQVVSGGFAWNETEPGMNATPMPAAVAERLIQLWSTPMGALRAAALAGANAKLTTENGLNVLTFPLPAPLANATMSVTLNNQEITMATGQKRRINNLVERVEARIGGTETVTTYGDYGDWNEKDYKADVLLPKRIIQKQGDGTLLDLTVSVTNTYNPYVIMPVPEKVERAAR